MLSKAIICFFLLSTGLLPQSLDIKFENLTAEDGLSQDMVFCILQDKKGFMWIGTTNGLNRYDGYNFRIYRNKINDSTSISHNWIYTIYEDHQGELWLGTYGGGLNKYDRKKDAFIRIRHDPEDINSLSSDKVTVILEDKSNNMWIGTGDGGLCYMIRELNDNGQSAQPRFIRYDNNSSDVNILPHNDINSLYEDSNGFLWISTRMGGLIQFDPDDQKFSSILFQNEVIDERHTTNLLYPDYTGKEERLLVGNTDKIIVLNLTSGTKQIYPKQNIIATKSILKTEEDVYWIGTDGDGVYIFDYKKETFSHLPTYYGTEGNLSHNLVYDLYQDNCANIWVATFGGGVNIYKPGKRKFKHYQLKSDAQKRQFDITSILEDETDNRKILWIGTMDHGLVKYNRNTGEYKQFKLLPARINFIYQDENRPELLWLGRDVHGLCSFNKKTGKIIEYNVTTYSPDWDANSPANYSTHWLKCFARDQEGYFWLGAGYGLFKFNRSDKSLVPHLHDPQNENSLSESNVRALWQDSTGIIWAGTLNKGLNRFNPGTGEFKRFEHDPEDAQSLSSNMVNVIYRDQSGRLWIGTHSGLNLLNEENDRFHIYETEQGLPGETIYGILEDSNGHLWISTNNGLVNFDAGEEVFRIYDIADGIQDNNFQNGSYYKSRTGEMFFGGKNGFNAFYPDSVKDNPHIPPLVITDFKIFNRSVHPREKSALKHSIPETREITLSYDQSVFSFEFAALDFTAPKKNRYAYQMEGVDLDWVYTDASRRFATYTQLSPGEYTFRVKGSNNDGVWNEAGISVKVIILPPWWRTSWAYTFYILFFGFVLFGLWRFQTNRLKMKQKMEMEHFEVEKLREVDQLKSRFFTNISHEFRTPLTLIKGPVKQIITGDFKGNLVDQCRMILRNSDRLLALINQILDISKLESGQMKLQVAKTDILKFIKGLVLSFSSLAETKKISLKITAPEELPEGYIDRDKLEKIITNLLSNAFKFTPKEGKILIEISTSEAFPGKNRGNTYFKAGDASPQLSHSIQIIISNTGPGIPRDQLDKIFDRFYQADAAYKKDSEGSGVGLALTKELVELHHGTITVRCKVLEKQPPESPFFKGDLFLTTFTITLPIHKESFMEDEIIEDVLIKESGKGLRLPGTRIQEPGSRNQYPATSIPVSRDLRSASTRYQKRVTSEQRKTKDEQRTANARQQKPAILIVEDNPDVTSYICSFLDNDYDIITAENGTIGLRKTLDKYPDLVISDVMMPGMDGFELCQTIKSDERISHIPVILLTAKADLSSKIEGLEFGADDYISKPFEADELKVRVRNLIEQRKKLREKFSRIIDVQPADIAVSSMDEQFLNRFMKVFEDRITDSELSTEELAREVGMSRSNLNRKLKALTDQPTHEFIRSLRLKRAAKLLQKSVGTIAEIAYMVGFNNPSHFAKVFRKQFGQTPGDFLEKNKSD